jgi:hypothetical protein
VVRKSALAAVVVVSALTFTACAPSRVTLGQSHSHLSSVGSHHPVPAPRGWIAHTITGLGVVTTIMTPPSWSHELTPQQNGWPASPNNSTFISSVALKPYCSVYNHGTPCSDSPVSLPPDSGDVGIMPTTVNGYGTPGGMLIDGYGVNVGSSINEECSTRYQAYSFDVALWVPAGISLGFCVSGPHSSLMKSLVFEIARTTSFRPESRTIAAPKALFGQVIKIAGTASPSRVPYCSPNETTPSVSAHVSESGATTTIGVTTTFRKVTSRDCGMPMLSTCGQYGGFEIFGPSGSVVWTWGPEVLGIVCIPVVDLLPIVIRVPSWTVPNALLEPGRYTVRVGTFDNGQTVGPALATTTFVVH